jgi:hypothetical protein
MRVDPVTTAAISKVTALVINFGEKRVRALWDKGPTGRVLLFLHAEFGMRTGKDLADIEAIYTDQDVRDEITRGAAGETTPDTALLAERIALQLTGIDNAQAIATEMAGRVPELLPFVADGSLAEVVISRQLGEGFEAVRSDISELRQQISGLDSTLEGLRPPPQQAPGRREAPPAARTAEHRALETALADEATVRHQTPLTPPTAAPGTDVTSAAAQALLEGPLDRAGQRENARRAGELLRAGNAHRAAELLSEVADALDAHAIEALATEYRRQAADAYEQAGDKDRAIELTVRVADTELARVSERVTSLVRRLERLVPAARRWLALGFQALEALYEQPEAGIAQLASVLESVDDEERALEWRARLVEMLVLREDFEEAVAAAQPLAGTEVRVGARLRLELDRLEALDRLGRDDDGWAAVIAWAAEVAGDDPESAAIVHQRRGIARARADDLDAAADSFTRAAGLWSRAAGAEDQVAEAYFAAQTAALTQAQLRPEGAELRPLAAALRGSAQTAAARAEAHETAGMHARILEQLPTALRRFWAALVEHHRAGNFRGVLFEAEMLGELYTKADEPADAVRFYILAGREERAAEAARHVPPDQLGSVLRIEGGRWERAAGLAAVAAVGRRLPHDVVAELGPRVAELAQDVPSSIVSPQPARRAKEALAALVLSMPAEQHSDALAVLRANLGTGLPDVQRAVAEALVLATNAGVTDATRELVESFLTDPGLSGVSVLWVAERIVGDTATYARVEEAAAAGQGHALEAIAAADVAITNQRVRAAFEAEVTAVVERPIVEEHETQRTVHMVSLEGTGISGRHVPEPLREQLLRFLLDVVTDDEQPEMNRFSAANAIHNVAPALSAALADEAIDALLPLAHGDYGTSPLDAPADRRPLRPSPFMFGEAGMLRPAALQALGPLLDVAPERQPDVEPALRAAFADGAGLLEAAFDLLAHTDAETPPIALSLALEDESARVRLAALRWWQGRGQGLPDEVAIARARVDANPNVRLVLVRLARTDADRGPPVLRAIADEDEDAYVRLFARQQIP